jgi:hypothetical protein
VAVGPPNAGHSRRDAHDRDTHRHGHDGGPPGRGIRVCRIAGRLELPDPERTPCYTPASGDADYLGSGCPNGRALDDIDTATELGRFGDSRTGDHTGTNGAAGSLELTGAFREPESEPDTRAQPFTNTFGGAHAKCDRRAHPLTHARTKPIPDGEAAAHAASVGGTIAIAVTARRAGRVLPFRISGRQQGKEAAGSGQGKE